MLNIKLAHRDVIDELIVKVYDNGAETNILPLDSFRCMFPRALDMKMAIQVEGLLKGSRMNLECYDDGRLRNHGSIKLKTSTLL